MHGLATITSIQLTSKNRTLMYVFINFLKDSFRIYFDSANIAIILHDNIQFQSLLQLYCTL